MYLYPVMARTVIEVFQFTVSIREQCSSVNVCLNVIVNKILFLFYWHCELQQKDSNWKAVNDKGVLFPHTSLLT